MMHMGTHGYLLCWLAAVCFTSLLVGAFVAIDGLVIAKPHRISPSLIIAHTRRNRQDNPVQSLASHKAREPTIGWQYFHDPGCEVSLSAEEHRLPAVLFSVLTKPFPAVHRAELSPHRFFRSVRELEEGVAYCSAVSADAEHVTRKPVKVFVADHAQQTLYLLVISQSDPRSHPFTIESFVRVFDRFALWRRDTPSTSSPPLSLSKENSHDSHNTTESTPPFPSIDNIFEKGHINNYNGNDHPNPGEHYKLQIVVFAPKSLEEVHGTAFQLPGRPPQSLARALEASYEMLQRDPHNGRLQRTWEVLHRVQSTLIVLCDVLPEIARKSK